MPEQERHVVPDGGEYAWLVFWQLWRGTRMSFAELEAYCRVTGTELEPWEIEALMAMDAAAAEWRAQNA